MSNQADTVFAEENHENRRHNGTNAGNQMAGLRRHEIQQEIHLQMAVSPDSDGNPQKDAVDGKIERQFLAPGPGAMESIPHNALINHDKCDSGQH